MSNQKRQPAGVPVGGEFAHNEHDEAGALAAPSSPALDTESRLAELNAAHEAALEAEAAAWFAHEFESLSDNGDTMVFISFDEDDDDDVARQTFTVETGDGYGELSDRAADLVPEHYRNGEITIRSNGDGTYTTSMEDYTSGETKTLVHDSDGRRSAAELKEHAEQLTSERATLRDEAEKVSIVSAFEQASDLTGKDSLTFIPEYTDLDGVHVGTLRLDGTSIAIAPSDETQVRAFGFYGESVKQITIDRDADGYTITREHANEFNKGTKTTTDRVTSDSKSRWSDPGLFWGEEAGA